MIPAKYDFFRKEVIMGLPKFERHLIKAYESLENKLVEAACDETELLYLMQKNRPFEKVAARFGRTGDEVYHLVQSLEQAIHEETLHRGNACRLKDMTEIMALYSGHVNTKTAKFYYLSTTNDRNVENYEARGASD